MVYDGADKEGNYNRLLIIIVVETYLGWYITGVIGIGCGLRL